MAELKKKAKMVAEIVKTDHGFGLRYQTGDGIFKTRHGIQSMAHAIKVAKTDGLSLDKKVVPGSLPNKGIPEEPKEEPVKAEEPAKVEESPKTEEPLKTEEPPRKKAKKKAKKKTKKRAKKTG